MMEKFKIDHFEESTAKSFPDFKSLTQEECVIIAQKWRENFTCENEVISSELMKIISFRSKPIQGCSAEDENFNLALLVEKLKVKPHDYVYLNWHSFDQIDEMRFKDLYENLSEIWYPSSDELDIFDSSFEWIISISDFGGISHWCIATP